MAPKPVEPELDVLENVNEAMDSKLLASYKLHMQQYKAHLHIWEKQHESFTKLIDFIHDTITLPNTIEIHPWNIRRALKQKHAPSDSARSLEMERQS